MFISTSIQPEQSQALIHTSLSHTTARPGPGETPSNSVHNAVNADFLDAHNSYPCSQQQLSPSKQRRVSFCRYHSEPDIRSVAVQTSSHFSFSSAFEAQCGKQRPSPRQNVTPVLPSLSSATSSADRRPSITHSATSLDWDRRHEGVLHGVTTATHISTRLGGGPPSCCRCRYV
jgi:hypothetical protein